MSKQVELRKSIQADILPIAHRMREADAKEVWDSHRLSPYKALLIGMKSIGNCWTILCDGIPEGMVGVSRGTLFISNRGIIWMLGTDVLVEDKRLFITLTRKLLWDVIKGYNYIENYISVENEIYLRWIESMGFNIAESIILNGVMFKKFYMNLDTNFTNLHENYRIEDMNLDTNFTNLHENYRIEDMNLDTNFTNLHENYRIEDMNLDTNFTNLHENYRIEESN